MAQRGKRLSRTLVLACALALAFAATASAQQSGASLVSDPSKVYELKWLSINSPFQDGSIGQKYLEDMFKIKITVVRVDDSSSANWLQQVNLLLASGDYPDVMLVTNLTDIASFAKRGALAEIPEGDIKKALASYYKEATAIDPNFFTYARVNGKNYAIPRIDTGSKYITPVEIRADWLTNVGEKLPVTLADLERVFTKFRNNDPDKNGAKDTYGMSMASDFTLNAYFPTIFGAYGVNPGIWQNRSGTLVWGFTEPGIKDALKTLHKWYQAELIDPEFITEKGRTNANDDIMYKFCAGRLGYLDTVSFDDVEWDNDGNLNAKWVANNPEWKAFAAAHVNDMDTMYVMKNFTSIPTTGPQPVYVNIKPPVGPAGLSGNYRNTPLAGGVVMGAQVAKDKGKYQRILEICNALTSNEDVYINTTKGPEGLVWKWNDKHLRVFEPSFPSSDLYHPQYRKTGGGFWANPFENSVPSLLTAFGGERAVQRYQRGGDQVCTGFPTDVNAQLAPLPSAAKYSNLETQLKEYVIKAVTGEIDIDSTYSAKVADWKRNGGDVLTKEANDWFKSLK